MNVAFRIVGFFVAFALLGAVVLLSTQFKPLINIPSLLLVIGVGGAGWLLAKGSRGLELAAKTLVGTLHSVDGAEAALVARSGNRAYWWAALLGTLIGLVQMLQRLDDPSTIGPAVAMALLCPFYATLFSFFVWNPLEGAAMARSFQGQIAP